MRVNIWINLSAERCFDGGYSWTRICVRIHMAQWQAPVWWKRNIALFRKLNRHAESVEYTERERKALLVSWRLRYPISLFRSLWSSNDYACDCEPHKTMIFYSSVYRLSSQNEHSLQHQCSREYAKECEPHKKRNFLLSWLSIDFLIGTKWTEMAFFTTAAKAMLDWQWNVSLLENGSFHVIMGHR